MSDSGNSTVRNPYAWNQNTNLLFIDQPTGTGFSYGTPVSNSTAAAADFVQILKLFYKKYPEYYNGGLHIFGESYGGHYLPASAAAIIDYNESSQSDPDFIKLPLKSIAIGNGLYNAKIQYKYLSKMACNSTYPPIFSQDTCDQIDVGYEVCARMIDDCFETNEANKCAIATSYCAIAVVGLYTYDDPNNNPYDVRSKCTTQPACYMKSAYAAEFLNQASVQQALHAKETNYQTCSTDVQITFMSDYDVIRSYDDRLAKVLDAGIPALIYNGDADWLCNWYGVKATMQNMDWSGKDKFNSAQDKPWVVDNKQAGELRASGGLTFLRVFEAGHMLAMDSPVNALAMINEWLENMAITA
ncbi:hypothetical protein GGF43_000699 [Coemansia sp. RSA 2618]|nr:hypothetical protein GGF43_000699 [Coemansia sp. RSA 2618]